LEGSIELREIANLVSCGPVLLVLAVGAFKKVVGLLVGFWVGRLVGGQLGHPGQPFESTGTGPGLRQARAGHIYCGQAGVGEFDTVVGLLVGCWVGRLVGGQLGHPGQPFESTGTGPGLRQARAGHTGGGQP